MRLTLLPTALLWGAGVIAAPQFVFEDCSNWDGKDSCRSGEDISYPADTDSRMWQTPKRDSSSYNETFQDYGELQGYAHVVYSEDRNSAVLKVITFSRSEDQVLCAFGDGQWSTECEKTFFKKDFDVAVSMATTEDDLFLLAMQGVEAEARLGDFTLKLDPVYFVWQNLEVSSPANTENGQKGAIVELFGWPFDDVASECEFLAKAGYMGVKVFPAQEHVETYHYLQNGELNPWWFQYQPVSYRLNSRLGSRKELRKMILTCRKHSVRVYADAVINHMTGGGNDVLEHRINRGSCVKWGAKNATGGSPYFTHSFTFGVNENTNERPGLEFPAVPYWAKHFHCDRPLNSWSSPFSLNYGWLSGLSDLNTQHPYVQDRIAQYLTDLMGIGFSGFRVDAAKHIRPDDLAKIFGKFRLNMGGGSLPADFISWLEVIIGGEASLLACQDSDYNYYTYLDKAILREGLSSSDLEKIKIWSSDYPKEFPICGSWKIPAKRFVVQNDDHDQQNPGSSSRDMADKGSVLVKEKDIGRHRMFEKQLFERRDADWKVKLVLSSYTFMNSGAQGYPDGKSDCKNYLGNPYSSNDQCKTVPYQKAFDPTSCGYSVYDQNNRWAEGSYTRVHRDKEIILAMRQWMGYSINVNNDDIGLSPHC